jgi:cobalt-zinc-cadmium efflux system protein
MTRQRRLAIAIGLNAAVIAVQVVAGIVSGSLGLLADAGHNLTDVAAVGASLVAVRMTRRPATARRSFGWHRATILAAQANAGIILLVTVLLVIESIGRLRDPQPVEAGVVVVAAAVAMVANGAAALLLHERDARPDLNMRSAALHMAGDAAASAGVLVAAVVMGAVGGWYWLDPAVSLVIALFIGWRAVGLLGETADVLLESTPAGLDPDALADAMAAVEGVEAVHDLHVWTLSSELLALAAHLVLEGHPTLEEAQVVGDRVKSRLWEGYRIGHATLELECEPCIDDSDTDPCGVDALSLPAVHGHHH